MEYGDKLDDIIEAAVARGDAPGVVAAVGRGDEGYVAAAGVMAVGGAPMQPDTLFRISSITKPVTAAVVLSLAEGGAFGLDEPVDRLLPELATAYERRDGELTVSDPPGGQWSRPPRFPDGAGGLVSTAEDLLRFGRMLLRPGGNPVLTAGTVAEMTRDQLTPAQRASVWPGFSFLDDRGWGYGVSVTQWGYTWDGGFGTAWSNIPDQDLTVV